MCINFTTESYCKNAKWKIQYVRSNIQLVLLGLPVVHFLYPELLERCELHVVYS